MVKELIAEAKGMGVMLDGQRIEELKTYSPIDERLLSRPSSCRLVLG